MLSARLSAVLFLLVPLVLGLSSAEEHADKTYKVDRSELRKSLSKDCTTQYTVTCLKMDMVTWVERLDENDDLSVIPGVSVVKENISDSASTGNVVAELAREFPNDPDARLDAYLWKKITGYFSTHSIKLNFWNAATEALKEEGRGEGGGLGGGGGGGGGGGKKGNGGMGMLLAAGAMMKGTLMAVAMGGIAAIAGKALMTGLISLMLSAIIGLKALTSGGHKQTTYEIVAKPIYSHSNSHSVSHEEHGGGHYGHSGYGRSFDTAPLPLGLQPEYKPNP